MQCVVSRPAKSKFSGVVMLPRGGALHTKLVLEKRAMLSLDMQALKCVLRFFQHDCGGLSLWNANNKTFKVLARVGR